MIVALSCLFRTAPFGLVLVPCDPWSRPPYVASRSKYSAPFGASNRPFRIFLKRSKALMPAVNVTKVKRHSIKAGAEQNDMFLLCRNTEQDQFTCSFKNAVVQKPEEQTGIEYYFSYLPVVPMREAEQRPEFSACVLAIMSVFRACNFVSARDKEEV